MYCYNCGKTFHPNEIVRDVDPDSGPMYCCPYCGVNDIADTEECDICGKEIVEGEISHGFCLSCLWNEIDYFTALDYMKSKKGYLSQFIIQDWFGAVLEETSDNLDKFLEETFRRLVADEKLSVAVHQEPKLTTPSEPFLTACRFFCLPYYANGDFGVEGDQFAEWFKKYTKTKSTKNTKN